MKYYSLTITNNTRLYTHELQELQQPILAVIDVLHNLGFETGHHGWEFQKRKPHCLHLHTFFTAEKMPLFKKINPNKSLSVRCYALPEPDDVTRWVEYCHKEDYISLPHRFDLTRVDLYNDNWFFQQPIPNDGDPQSP